MVSQINTVANIPNDRWNSKSCGKFSQELQADSTGLPGAAAVPMEHIRGDNDSQDYRDCDLDGVHARMQGFGKLGRGYVVRAPEHPGTGNQREYAADKENRAGAQQSFRREARHESHQGRREQSRRKGSHGTETHDYKIGGPAKHSHHAACGAILQRNTEQHCK